MMQPPTQQVPAGVQPQQQAQQQPQVSPELIEDTIASVLDENPEMKQKLHQALQDADAQGAFDDLSPEEMQQILGLLQQIITSPQSYPQVYQQIMQSGGSPEDFPPPDTPTQEVQKFAEGILVVLFYMGKLGQTGGAQGGPPPPQGGQMPPQQGGQMPPQQGGVQGYPAGGVVGQPAANSLANMNAANAQTIQNFNQTGRPGPELSNVGSAQAINTGQAQGQAQFIDANNPEFAKMRIAEQQRLSAAYGQSPDFRGYGPRTGTVIRGRNYTNDPISHAKAEASYNTDPYAGKSVDDIYNDVPSHNVQPARSSGGTPHYVTPPPELHWSPQGQGLNSLDTPGTFERNIRGVDYYTTDPWKKEYGGSFPGSEFGATYHGWKPEGQEQFYPVRSQQQLNDYIQNNDYSSGKAYWEGGDPRKNRRQTPHQADLRNQNYYQSFLPGYEPYSLPGLSGQQPNGYRKQSTFGFPDGGMVPPTNAPIQTNTGDDQMIAAKTGEGVLNIDAVNMLGGPQAVNQLNYQASGQMPGGQPVSVINHGYNRGGMVGEQLADYGYRRDKDYGYSRGGMVGGDRAVTASGWVWSDRSQKYVLVSNNSKQYSGRVMKAMGFFKKWGFMIGSIVSIAAMVAAPYIMPLISGAIAAATGMTAAAAAASTGLAVASGAVYGGISGAVIGGLSTGSLKGALIGGGVGALAGGIGGYFSHSAPTPGAPNTGVGGNPNSFSSSVGSVSPFDPAPGGLAGFNTDLGSAAMAGTGGTGGVNLGGSVLGGGPTVGGALLDPFASSSGSLTPGAGPQGPVLGQAGSLNQSQPVVQHGVTAAPAKGGILDGIVDHITDPKFITQTGGRLLAGALTEEPDFGYDQYGAAAANQMNKQSELLDLQRQQYEKNVVPLQNQGTGLARMAANPAFTASQSSNAFKLGSSHRRREQEEQLTRAGVGPGSPQYVDAMRKFDNAERLGSTGAYNTGYVSGVNSGMQGLSSAKNLHDTPEYSNAASAYANLGANSANIKQNQWNAQRQEADAMGRLFFPPDPDERLRESDRLNRAN